MRNLADTNIGNIANLARRPTKNQAFRESATPKKTRNVASREPNPGPVHVYTM